MRPSRGWDAPQSRMGNAGKGSESVIIGQSPQPDGCLGSRMVRRWCANETRSVPEWVKNGSRMGTEAAASHSRREHDGKRFRSVLSPDRGSACPLRNWIEQYFIILPLDWIIPRRTPTP